MDVKPFRVDLDAWKFLIWLNDLSLDIPVLSYCARSPLIDSASLYVKFLFATIMWSVLVCYTEVLLLNPAYRLSSGLATYTAFVVKGRPYLKSYFGVIICVRES